LHRLMTSTEPNKAGLEWNNLILTYLLCIEWNIDRYLMSKALLLNGTFLEDIEDRSSPPTRVTIGTKDS
jgi:hypothetical protein